MHDKEKIKDALGLLLDEVICTEAPPDESFDDTARQKVQMYAHLRALAVYLSVYKNGELV